MFEVSLEVKEDKNEIKKMNESVYIIESRAANAKIDLSFNKKIQTTIDYQDNKEDTIRFIKKNYLDYYYRNSASIDKFKLYRDILSSIDFEKRNPNTEDFKILNKLFSLSYDDNTNSTIDNSLVIILKTIKYKFKLIN